MINDYFLRWRSLAAVVLVVVVEAELLTVVTAADKAPLAAGNAVVKSTIAWTIAVTLALSAGVLGRTAPPFLHSYDPYSAGTQVVPWGTVLTAPEILLSYYLEGSF